MINNTVKMSEFTEITQVDETTKVVIIQGEPAFNAYIDASLIGGGNISGETAARISADTSLSTSLTTETFERLSADTSLSTAILTETFERVSADTILSTAISTETSQRVSADESIYNTLSTELSTEMSQRISTDTSLSTQISTETFERISTDTSLTNLISTELSTEMSQRISTDQSLESGLATTTLIAKGAQRALGFQNYGVMVNYVNSLEEPIDETTKVGQSIFINTLDVPDIWISGTIFPSHIPTHYTYISDQKLIDDVNANGGYLQIGFYFISFLETQKVDLTNYITNTELSTAISTEESIRLSVDQSLSSALSTEISERISADLSLSTAIGSGGGGGGGISETFVDITLLSSNWVSNIQTITAVGVTTTNTITVYAPLNRDQYLEYGRCQISATSQGADTLTFTNSENPIFDISLKISYR